MTVRHTTTNTRSNAIKIDIANGQRIGEDAALHVERKT
jgi:hypothetical protein